MIKVLFVDDEVLAMEYLHNLIAWEEHGFTIIGQALNGKRALELFKAEKPDIVISDIKMVGIDGLELTKLLKQITQDVIVILLSAYQDFEYAQKGIECGVFNYLLKHELCQEKLLEELGKAKKQLEEVVQKKKIYRQYFMKQLIYNSAEEIRAKDWEFGNRFFLILIHKNDRFEHGMFQEVPWSQEEMRILSEVLEETESGIYYLTDLQLTESTIIVLYRIEQMNSKYMVNTRIEQISRRALTEMSKLFGLQLNGIYSEEVHSEEISATFQRMSWQIRYAVFWRPCCIYAISKLFDSMEEKIFWNEQIKELKEQIYKGVESPRELICYLFEKTIFPKCNLKSFKELLYLLENLAIELEEYEEFDCKELKLVNEKAENIRNYYVERFEIIFQKMLEKENKRYSKLVVDTMRYIKQSYRNEIRLEQLGDQFQMNGVYLGQVFKKETGNTILQYLTNCRMEEAKNLLETGELNISEVADKVGYKTSQYFSQIFMKSVGVTPQEYKKWSQKR